MGYKYSTLEDTLQISGSSIDQSINTKRGILTQTATLFELLSLCLPVTIRGKMLLRDLWSQKSGWDDIVSEEYQTILSALSHDLIKLDSLKFPRFITGEDSPTDIFRDASKGAYGFAVYSVEDGGSHLAFAKAKVAPMKPKSLPTHELMAVFLAIKCLLPLLKAYPRIRIGDIVISVDTQIVLSWLLSDNIKTKNQFVKNRLKDIRKMIRELKEEKSLSVKFRYVHTEQNPAGLLTRGDNFEKFSTKSATLVLGT